MSDLTIDDLWAALSRLGEAHAYQQVREPVIMHASQYERIAMQPDAVRLPTPGPRHAVVTGLALLGVTL